MSRPSNIWDLNWDFDDDPVGMRGARLLERPEGTRLVAAVWELDSGIDADAYHVHHATDEMLVVLRGTPTLRTGEGERELREGDVVHLPMGPDAAHQVLNRSSGPVRYMMVAAHSALDIIEYLDDEKVVVYSNLSSPQKGEPLFWHRLTESDGKGP